MKNKIIICVCIIAVVVGFIGFTKALPDAHGPALPVMLWSFHGNRNKQQFS